MPFAHMHIIFNEVNIRSHSNDYNWRTIYHLANDCNDTFTLIRAAKPLFTWLPLPLPLLSLHIATHLLAHELVLQFNNKPQHERISYRLLIRQIENVQPNRKYGRFFLN